MVDSISPQSGSRPPTIESVADHETIGSNIIIDPESTSKRKREEWIQIDEHRRAPVWLHYEFWLLKGEDGKPDTKYAFCKYCREHKYKASSGYGTSNASIHLKSCQAYLKFVAENPHSGAVFDQKVFIRLFAEAIMFHSYSLSIVEHEKLRVMLSYLQPKVQHVSRNTILKYCVKEHEILKATLHSKLDSIDSRICFTCDCWSTITKHGYLTLIAHYVDNEWVFPSPHKVHDIYAFVLGLLKEWGLESKTFSLTVDNASSNDVMITLLKSDIHSSSLLPCDGKFFHVRCCAHILNLIVQSGMQTIDVSVDKLRQLVLYIDASDIRKCKFDQYVKEMNVDFVGKLQYDVCTRWNSTYKMIKRCLEARKAIDLFATRESNFDYGLSTNEWEVVEFVCKFLEPFNDITTLFSGSDYPTANLYLLHVVAIEKWLVLAHNHNVPSIQLMCQSMMEKYEKYWSDHAIILSVAVVLDPRFKLKFVKGLYSMVYVPSEVDVRVRKVYDAMVELYDFYRSSSSQTIPLPSQSYSNRSHSASSYSSHQFSTTDFMNDFFSSNSSCGEIDSKLDNYLNASLVANEDGFDVLKYWQSQKSIYPVLSRMAKDILAIPITSVASESSFSMGGRVLTKFRTFLLSKNVEAFVTTQNWLFGYLQEEELEDCLDEADAEEDE
ncbi:putative AC transposase, partial [Bienertia sinuspersici]